MQSELLPYLAVKGRSRGAALVLAFQDMDGFKEAAGERIANEIVAQCSNKALLRMESETSAAWASKTLGQFETIEVFRSDNQTGWNQNISEQRVQKDAVMASEFFSIPITNPQNGLTGYFITSEDGAYRGTIHPSVLAQTVFDESQALDVEGSESTDEKQWLCDWEESDWLRLSIEKTRDDSIQENEHSMAKRKKLRLAQA